MLRKIVDKIDAFARWFDDRFFVRGDDLPNDTVAHWRALKRLIAYIPTIWYNVDFAATPGIFELMKKKLERLEPTITFSMWAESHRRRIRICIKLLNVIINDIYSCEYQAWHEEKWGEFNWRCKDLRFVCSYSKAITKEQIEQERKEYLAGHHWACAQRQKAINLCMKMIAHYADEWWD